MPQGQPAPPGRAAGGGAEDPGPYGAVPGFGDLITAARVPADGASALFRDVEALGAIDAHELQPDDWRALPSWGGLRELERRRVLVYLQHAIQWGVNSHCRCMSRFAGFRSGAGLEGVWRTGAVVGLSQRGQGGPAQRKGATQSPLLNRRGIWGRS